MKCLPQFLIASLFAANAHAAQFEGRVIGVSDGDTIKILDTTKTQIKVRINGIDAPEKGQAFGNRAKEAMSDLVFGKTVSANCTKTDRYQREICVVTIDRRDVGLELIKQGLAWHFKKYEKDQAPGDRVAYADAENVARTKRIGLWSDSEPIPPWEWRKRQKRNDSD
jgi:endonuclease YncB( thermonuclease family)